MAASERVAWAFIAWVMEPITAVQRPVAPEGGGVPRFTSFLRIGNTSSQTGYAAESDPVSGLVDFPKNS